MQRHRDGNKDRGTKTQARMVEWIESGVSERVIYRREGDGSELAPLSAPVIMPLSKTSLIFNGQLQGKGGKGEDIPGIRHTHTERHSDVQRKKQNTEAGALRLEGVIGWEETTAEWVIKPRWKTGRSNGHWHGCTNAGLFIRFWDMDPKTSSLQSNFLFTNGPIQLGTSCDIDSSHKWNQRRWITGGLTHNSAGLDA